MNCPPNDSYKNQLTRLDMLRPDGAPTGLYFVAEKKSAEPRIRFALDQAEFYNANAVFFREFPDGDPRSPLPQIYIYSNPDLTVDERHYAKIQCRLWNAGVVPLVFILTATQVKILNCRQEPNFDPERREPLYTPFSILEKLVLADQAFVARGISAGTFWEDPQFKDNFVLEKTAYYQLLDHLKNFRQDLLKRQILAAATANRILVMAILVKYLSDRQDSGGNRVFKEGFLRKFSHADSDDPALIFQNKGGCLGLFAALSEHFNGGIFELSAAEKAELEKADLSLIADFLKGDIKPGGQLLFWPLYSFQDLPVELISNIYEEFLATSDKKTSKGVVYTPPMLVDFLLDQCLPLQAETLSWKILDPACGSGVFLVGAFKRLIQCWRLAHDWKQPSHLDLQEILKDSIFGFDKAPEAVLITAFSLCVALCDELDPLVIWNELKFDNLQERNLQGKDFFEIIESGEFDNYFDVVIGNPPFESTLTTEAAQRVEEIQAKERPKLPDTQLALLFLEQSFRLAREEAAVCLIQPAGPLLYNGNARQFRSYLLERFAIDQVFDFTALEGTLFRDKKVAAAAVVGRKTPANTNKILHVTFRRTKAIKEKLLFELDPYDFHWLTRQAMEQNQYGWKANLLGGGRLHRMLARIFSDFPTLGEYLDRKRDQNGWQFGEGYSVGCGSYLNKLPNAKELTELPANELMRQFKLKNTLELAPWITGQKNVPPIALTKYGIAWEKVTTCKELFFERPRTATRHIFAPPPSPYQRSG